MRDGLSDRPQLLGAVAATAATLLGIAVMAAAGAPRAYMVINAAALVIGLALLAVLLRSRLAAAGVGGLLLAAAAGLLATALFGTETEGAVRWVRIGGVVVQPALVLLPLMVVAFAQAQTRAATLAMLVAALALAVQPDRAMAGALAAGLLLVAAGAEPGAARRRALLALGAALAGFGVTLLRADDLPPTRFVEQVYADAFGVSPLAGLAVLAGAALMLLPVLARREQGKAALVFAAVWLAILLAAALGNYPTPLLGYGGSGIIGYLLSLTALPRRGRHSTGEGARTSGETRPPRDGSAFAAPRLAG